jgi:hypothetical protein
MSPPVRPCRICCEVRCLTGKTVSTVRPGPEPNPWSAVPEHTQPLPTHPNELSLFQIFSSPGKTGRVDENQLFDSIGTCRNKRAHPLFFKTLREIGTHVVDV